MIRRRGCVASTGEGMGDTPLHEVSRAIARATSDLGDRDLVLIACSGGPDSLALAAASARLASRPGQPRFGAVVVDHQLQPGSGSVAERAAETCRSLGLAPVEVIAVSVVNRPGGAGPEAAARAARLRALREAARGQLAAAVLLGHTLDDQAETVLLGLARGSGSRSLAGMSPIDGLWRRPALGLRRDVLRAACAEAGIRPHWDPHNADPAYARSRVRTVVLPTLEAELGPGIAEALARSADMMRADADVLDRLAADWLESHLPAVLGSAGGSTSGSARDPASQPIDGGPTCDRPEGTPQFEVPVPQLSTPPAAVRTRILRLISIAAGAPPGALTRDHILRIDQLISAWRGQGAIALPGQVMVERRDNRLAWGNE